MKTAPRTVGVPRVALERLERVLTQEDDAHAWLRWFNRRGRTMTPDEVLAACHEEFARAAAAKGGWLPGLAPMSRPRRFIYFGDDQGLGRCEFAGDLLAAAAAHLFRLTVRSPPTLF